MKPWYGHETEKRPEIERSILVPLTSLLVISSSITFSEVIGSRKKLSSDSTQV